MGTNNLLLPGIIALSIVALLSVTSWRYMRWANTKGWLRFLLGFTRWSTGFAVMGYLFLLVPALLVHGVVMIIWLVSRAFGWIKAIPADPKQEVIEGSDQAGLVPHSAPLPSMKVMVPDDAAVARQQRLDELVNQLETGLRVNEGSKEKSQRGRPGQMTIMTSTHPWEPYEKLALATFLADENRAGRTHIERQLSVETNTRDLLFSISNLEGHSLGVYTYNAQRGKMERKP
jgi:hypothetical protein